MSDYRVTGTDEAYSLLNDGGLVLVCTKGPGGRYDIAPIAWNCPVDYEGGSKVLFVSDPSHESCKNLLSTGEFALALPTPELKEMVLQTGSVSAAEADKIARFGIKTFKARVIDALLPEGIAGWLECSLARTVDEGSVTIVIGKVLHAEAVAEAWKSKLHYGGEGIWYSPGRPGETA